jgi:hypothetical protein
VYKAVGLEASKPADTAASAYPNLPCAADCQLLFSTVPTQLKHAADCQLLFSTVPTQLKHTRLYVNSINKHHCREMHVITRMLSHVTAAVAGACTRASCMRACCSLTTATIMLQRPYLSVKPAQEAPPARCAHARQQRLRLCAADERFAGRARLAVRTAMLLLLLLRLLLLALQPRDVYSVCPYRAQTAFVCCIVFI